jgi:CheY-like chemotaxis protein
MGKRILLVDDNPLVLELTKLGLEDMGYQVCAVPSGSVAIKKLGSGRAFDLVVTDVLMANSNGADVAAAARRRDGNMRVLYITGFVPEELIPLVKANSNAEILYKPFSGRKWAKLSTDLRRRRSHLPFHALASRRGCSARCSRARGARQKQTFSHGLRPQRCDRGIAGLLCLAPLDRSTSIFSPTQPGAARRGVATSLLV